MNMIHSEYTAYPMEKYFDICAIISAFEYTYGRNHYFEGEAHDFWEFVCVIDGSIDVISDDHIYELGKNQIIFHRPLEFHRLWSANGTSPHLLIMSFQTAHSFKIKRAVYSLRDEMVKELQKLINLAENIFIFDDICVVDQKEDRKIDLQIFIDRLEVLILTILKEEVTFDTRIKSGISAGNYEMILTVLKKNLHRKLSLNQIAEMCSMSKSNLKKTFSKYTDRGVIEYFNYLKVLEGIRLLKHGMAVGEISRALGFTEQNYFSQVFKRVTGVSPTNYRIG